MPHIRRLWLLFGKMWALAFIFFGGGVLAIATWPILAFSSGPQHTRTQYFIHLSFRFYLRMLTGFRFLYLEIGGVEKFSDLGGRIIIANHPSLLDVVILMSLIPKAQCVVKHELWNHKFLGKLMRQAGYIRNDLDPDEIVGACKSSIDEGRCLIIFPEGTRTPPGALPHFQRGFANVAIMANIPIQTVLIMCSPPFLYKGEKWWHVPDKTPVFKVSAGESLDGNSYLRYGQRSLAARKLAESLEQYYAEQLCNSRSRTGTQEAHH